MKTPLRKIVITALLGIGFSGLSAQSCTNTCTVTAGSDLTSCCPGMYITIGATTCMSGTGCTRTITWSPANLIISGQGTCRPVVNPSVTTNFIMKVKFGSDCCCAGTSGDCGADPPSCDTLIRRDTMKVTVNSSCCGGGRMMNPSAHSEIDNLQIKVNPNPTTGKISVEISSLHFSDQNVAAPLILLYDYSGKMVTTRDADKNVTNLDLSLFPKGIYFMRIIQGEEVLMMKKIVFN